jgi:arginine utilization regulatory protein
MNGKIYIKLVQKILQHLDEGVHFIDKDGNTIIYNEAMSKLEKMSRKEVLNKSFFDVFKGLDNESSTLIKALQRGEMTKNNIQTYLNKHGREITTVNTTMPIVIEDELIGALEISKDITNIKELSDRVVKLQSNIQDVQKLDKKINKYTFEDIIGESEKFIKAIELSKKASKTPATVLIYGETGTGKELISQGIHNLSNRSNMPFIAQNCAALPETLLEGILFGTTKGGFTGALDRPGLFEQANGGTLLLDEINSMPIQLQAKLLRVLQEGYVRRVGGTKDIPVDVRIITTTNENPKDILSQGKIRKDLYYRLNVILIEIPPLRRREKDILLLANNFIDKYNKKLNKNILRFSDNAQKLLMNHSWNGNVRELENTIYSAMSIIDKEEIIDSSMLNIHKYYEDNEANNKLKESNNIDNIEIQEKCFINELDINDRHLEEVVDEIEIKLIKNALETEHNNISKAAKKLGIKRQSLQYKLKKYNL